MTDRAYVYVTPRYGHMGVFRTVHDAIIAASPEVGDRIEMWQIGHFDSSETYATYQTWGWDFPPLEAELISDIRQA